MKSKLIFDLLMLSFYPFVHIRTDDTSYSVFYFLGHANLLHLFINCISGILLIRNKKDFFLVLAGCIVPYLIWPIPLPAQGCSAGLYTLASYRVQERKNYISLLLLVFAVSLSSVSPYMANTLHLGGIAVGITLYYIIHHEDRILRQLCGSDIQHVSARKDGEKSV